MPLNFTGGAGPDETVRPAGRTPVVILACFGAAAILAGLVFAAALRQHQVTAPVSAPPLVGIDRALAAVPPAPPAPPLAPAAPELARPPVRPPAPAPAQAPPPQAAPAPGPRTLDRAAAKARMLAALRQVPHGVVTLSVEDDAGAAAYARELADLFRQAGWRVDQVSAFGPGLRRHGLAAAFGVSPSDEAMREAFDAVGFQLAPPPPDAGVISTPEIFVGAP
jgi:hypothetical protein